MLTITPAGLKFSNFGIFYDSLSWSFLFFKAFSFSQVYIEQVEFFQARYFKFAISTGSLFQILFPESL